MKVANGVNMAIKGKGTVTWKLEDDDGVVHKINMSNALCVLTLEHCFVPVSCSSGIRKSTKDYVCLSVRR